MINPYLQNLRKIEFVVTHACTGKCKHCSEGDHAPCGESIEPAIAADAVKKIASVYDIKTVMAFGGEPLLHPDAVEKIMQAAKEMKVPCRQLITNGYFSKSPDTIKALAFRLAACGVNDLLLSVDAFHQETIPLDTVKLFAREANGCGIPVRLQPAWLVSKRDDNPYNKKTRELLDSFGDTGLPVGEGNLVFPEGNAQRYLAEYFKDNRPANPYAEDPYDVRCLSFSPNGDVLGGNIYRSDILEIIASYRP